MPTYQYRCTGCGQSLEVVQRFSDDALTVCPACSAALRKVFSPVGVVFKGSGFYKTDSRSKPAAAKTAEAKPEPAAASSSAEAKPAADATTARPAEKVGTPPKGAVHKVA